MRSLMIVVIHLCAALLPFTAGYSKQAAMENSFPGWPSELSGRTLTPLPMTEQEQEFSQGFPGRIGRFSDGTREIIIRYVQQPTRLLHPSADCLRGSGFAISPRPVTRDNDGRLWGCALAERGNERYRVCEHLRDEEGNGWYDVSSWYWSTILKNSKGPWWAVTVAERV